VDEPPDEQETVTSWTNPWIAEYKRRQAMLMEMRPFEVIAMLRDLNLTSYAFSTNAQELHAHIARYPEIGNSQPFNPDVGDPFVMELSRLLANTLASAKSLISVQRAILRDIWPGVGKCHLPRGWDHRIAMRMGTTGRHRACWSGLVGVNRPGVGFWRRR
jgi:hypothetical protein